MVNQPDFSSAELRLNGAPVTELELRGRRQRLHMDCALAEWEYRRPPGRRRGACEGGEVPQHGQQAYGGHALHPEGGGAPPRTARCRWGLDGAVRNLPIADNQMQENTEFARIWGEVRAEATADGGRLHAQHLRELARDGHGLRRALHGRGGALRRAARGNMWAAGLTSGCGRGRARRWRSWCPWPASRDGAEPDALAGEALDYARQRGFEGMLEDTRRAWAGIWRDVDIELTGCDEWQGALRYNILQLVQSAPEGDGRASIGARGLTHGRYKGLLLLGRGHIHAAHVRLHAPAAPPAACWNTATTPWATPWRARGASPQRGPEYSWMSADTGFEQCETWDTGCCEVHITADVAYAIGAYCAQTGDVEFLRDCGCEMLVQTARYWTDRFSYCPEEDRYHLL